MSLKKTVTAVSLAGALLVGAAVLPGCSSNWLANFKSNPVAAAQQFETTANALVSEAQAAWPAIVGFLPAANQATATTAFNDAVFTFNHAEVVLNDAIQTAVDVGNQTPDFSAAMASVSDAVNQIIAVVKQFQGAAVVVDGGVPAMGASPRAMALSADLQHGSETLTRLARK